MCWMSTEWADMSEYSVSGFSYCEAAKLSKLSLQHIRMKKNSKIVMKIRNKIKTSAYRNYWIEEF